MTVKPSSHESSADATVLPEIWGQHSLPSTHTQTKGFFFFFLFFFSSENGPQKTRTSPAVGAG